MARVVVVGTGTGVGKTHLASTLVRALALLGQPVIGLKPVESGVGTGISDAAHLEAAGSFHVKHPPPYAFPDPVSPHLAARRAGVVISIPRVVSWVVANAALWTIVESAGALLSPLSAKLTNLDLVLGLSPDAVILVGRDRLGILHEVCACRLALDVRAPSLPAPLVVLQPPEVPDASTGTNAEELLELGLGSQVLAMPHGPAGSPALVEAVAPLLRQLERFT